LQRIDVELIIIDDVRRRLSLSGCHPRAVGIINSIAKEIR
jgi:hypothetical protein